MQKTQITLNNFQGVRKFVNEVTLLDYEVDLEQGRYIVDAKSIMGIFALDTLSPITVVAHTDAADEFFNRISEFIVK
jgi:phosphotransferase system HPr-like phosphotransfer protein